MNEVKRVDLNDNDKDIFIDEIPDEALELAACAGPENGGAYTIAFCTGQAECPF